MVEVAREIPWRRPIASLNYLLTSHVWRQDHNGFSHQDPGFIDHVVNKKADVVRVYLPPDANTLLSTVDHCLRSRNYVNVIVAGKHRAAMARHGRRDQALHGGRRSGRGPAATTDAEPDVVMACCGDVPTLETLAAVDLLHQASARSCSSAPSVNIVDLMGSVRPKGEHPHGLSDFCLNSILMFYPRQL